MKIKMSVLVMVVALSGCIQEPKNTVRIDTVSHEFGPFFLPADKSMNSVSINYFTEEERPTSILFSMVGNIDWLRTDPKPSSFHKMVFSGLEESAVYQFRVNIPSDNFMAKSYIKTPPYGDNYRYDFAIVSINSPFTLSRSPHFLILLSKDPSVGEDEFIAYYKKNKKILSSTVLVPLFDMSIRGIDFSLSRDGFFVLRYKSANIILIYMNFDSLERTALPELDNSSEDNYIISSISDRTRLIKISEAFHLRVKAIYCLNRDLDFNPEWITVEKKDNYALKN
jgi:hypothetical protein